MRLPPLPIAVQARLPNVSVMTVRRVKMGMPSPATRRGRQTPLSTGNATDTPNTWGCGDPDCGQKLHPFRCSGQWPIGEICALQPEIRRTNASICSSVYCDRAKSLSEQVSFGVAGAKAELNFHLMSMFLGKYGIGIFHQT